MCIKSWRPFFHFTAKTKRNQRTFNLKKMVLSWFYNKRKYWRGEKENTIIAEIDPYPTTISLDFSFLSKRITKLVLKKCWFVKYSYHEWNLPCWSPRPPYTATLHIEPLNFRQSVEKVRQSVTGKQQHSRIITWFLNLDLYSNWLAVGTWSRCCTACTETVKKLAFPISKSYFPTEKKE